MRTDTAISQVNYQANPNPPPSNLYFTPATVDIAPVYVSEQKSYLFYPKIMMRGFEVALPIGSRFTLCAEESEIETLKGLGFHGRHEFTIHPEHYNYAPTYIGAVDRAALEFLDAIGSDYVQISNIANYVSNPVQREPLLQATALYAVKIITSASGVLYTGKKWRTSFTRIKVKTLLLGPQDLRILQAYNRLIDFDQPAPVIITENTD